MVRVVTSSLSANSAPVQAGLVCSNASRDNNREEVSSTFVS
jgi:hypothetical protein